MNSENNSDDTERSEEQGPRMMRERGTLVFGALAGVAAAYAISVHNGMRSYLFHNPDAGHWFVARFVVGAVFGALVSLFVDQKRPDSPITFNRLCLIVIAIGILYSLIPTIGC